MGFLAPTVTDERDAISIFLVQQCEQLRIASLGLSDEQARQQSTAGALSILGLLTHVAQTVEMWLVAIEVAPEPRTRETIVASTEKMGLPADGYFSGAELPTMTLEQVVAVFEKVIASIPARVAALDFDVRVPVPDAPWFPDDLDSWNGRWVLFHLITEVARHAGQADIVRESIDGAIAYALNAQDDGQSWDG